MESLIAATALFLGMHWIVSGSPLRGVIVARMGEGPFKAVFALTITVSIVWMGWAYAHAPYVQTWGTAAGLKPVSWVLMALAFVMFGASATDKNPTTLGRVPPDQVEARGMVRITRHAGLFGLGLWGLAHFIVNGDWASHLLFGSFAFQGLIAPLNLDVRIPPGVVRRLGLVAARRARIVFRPLKRAFLPFSTGRARSLSGRFRQTNTGVFDLRARHPASPSQAVLEQPVSSSRPARRVP